MRLDFYLHETFGSQRIKELFDIIREFPDSLPAIEVVAIVMAIRIQSYLGFHCMDLCDTNCWVCCVMLQDLRRCLERTRQHPELVHNFRKMLSKRLLHPGAETSQILDLYISLIKSFRLLDPQGVI